MIYLAWQMRQSRKTGTNPPSSTLVLLLSILAIALSGVLISKEMERMKPYVYDPAADEALGRSLTGYFLPDVSTKPSVVIISQGVVTEDGLYENRVSQARLGAFLEEMKARGYSDPVVLSPWSVLSKLTGNSDFVDESMLMDTGLPSKVLIHVWETHPNADVYISLDGAPRGEGEKLAAYKPKNSRFYALDLWEIEDIRENLSGGVIDGVVTYRTEPNQEPSSSKESFVFEDRYVFVKAK